MMLFRKFSPLSPISLINQIQAAHPSFRNLGKNENFPKLVSIYTTREIVSIAIQKATIFIIAGPY